MTVARDVVQPVVSDVVGSVMGNWTLRQDVIDLFNGGTVDGLIYDILDASANNVARDGTGANVTDGASLGRRGDLSGNDNHGIAPADGQRGTWDLVSGTPWVTHDGVDDGYAVGAQLTKQEYDLYVSLNTSDTSFAVFDGVGGRYVSLALDGSSGSPYSNAGTPTHYVNNSEISPDTRDNLSDTLTTSTNLLLNIRGVDFDDGTGWTDFRIDLFGGGFKFSGRLGSVIAIPTSVISADSTAHAKCYNFIAEQIRIATI